MSHITTIGIDTSKSSFALYGIDDKGNSCLKKTVNRKNFLPFFANLEKCIVALEACGASHHWAREIEKLGHEVKIIPPQKVAAFRQVNKNDANDA